MPRALTGRIEPRVLADGRRAFYAKIRDDRHALGQEPDWTKQRAELFLTATLLPAAKLKQPWWELIPSVDADSEPDGLTFWQAADEWIQLRRLKSENANTRNANESPVVKHLLPFFAHADDRRSIERLVTEIDESLVQEFIEQKRLERDVLTDLADKLNEASEEERRSYAALKASESADLDELELTLLWRYGQQGGRHKLSDPDARGRISLSSRGLRDAEINRCMSRLSSILDRAARKHGLRIPDPTVDLRLRVDRPARNWLWPHHLEALARVARALDEGSDRYAYNGREAAIWVLGLCGPRVHELCGFNWHDLTAAGLSVRKSKTAAGVRTIQVPDIAREALELHRQRLGPPPADTPIWPTATGARRDGSSIRTSVVAPVVQTARDQLTDTAEPLPPRVTPHTFRRTTATYWYWLGRGERDTMHEIGHRSSRLTLEVYAQARPRDPRQQQLLERWMQGVEL